MDHTENYFGLFNLPVRFQVDLTVLEQAYHTIQSHVHPDHYSYASAFEKRLALQRAAQANEAYQTLKSPLQRAIYLCKLQGIDVTLERSSPLASDFLMQQMEWREALQQARNAGEIGLLQKLETDVQHMEKQLEQTLERQFDHEHRYADAAETVCQLMFVHKFANDLDLAYFSLEN